MRNLKQRGGSDFLETINPVRKVAKVQTFG
jgi:hypothetical protein